MNRLPIEQLLKQLCDMLASAVDVTAGSQPDEFSQDDLKQTEKLLARWQGGETLEALKAELDILVSRFQQSPLSGDAAFEIGTVLGDLDRAISSLQGI